MTLLNTHRRAGSAAPLTSAWLAALLLAGTAQAADVSITVSRADGSPAAETVVVLQPVAAWSPRPLAEPVVVNQKDLRFAPAVVAMPVGSTLRLTNQDRYDHHVRAMAGGPLGNVPPATAFEVRLPAAKSQASSTDLKLDNPGTITLGCHIHGSMRGHVFISPSPWVGVTDEAGKLTLSGVPAGAADLKLWHPEQLTEQTSKRLDVGPATASAQASLNFSPKAKRPAANSGGYQYNY